jgi:hypothetical protein
MSNEPKYQPYSPLPPNADGNNDIKENTGANATEPYIPNSWNENFERNTFERGQK